MTYTCTVQYQVLNSCCKCKGKDSGRAGRENFQHDFCIELVRRQWSLSIDGPSPQEALADFQRQDRLLSMVSYFSPVIVVLCTYFLVERAHCIAFYFSSDLLLETNKTEEYEDTATTGNVF